MSSGNQLCATTCPTYVLPSPRPPPWDSLAPSPTLPWQPTEAHQHQNSHLLLYSVSFVVCVSGVEWESKGSICLQRMPGMMRWGGFWGPSGGGRGALIADVGHAPGKEWQPANHVCYFRNYSSVSENTRILADLVLADVEDQKYEARRSLQTWLFELHGKNFPFVYFSSFPSFFLYGVNRHSYALYVSCIF